MSALDDDIESVIVTADDIKAKTAELAALIDADYADREPMLVGVLKGAVFFVSDLMRHLDIPVEVDFMAVASYGSATRSSGVVRILKDLDAAIEDAHQHLRADHKGVGNATRAGESEGDRRT